MLPGNKAEHYLYYREIYFIQWEACREIIKLFGSLSGRNYNGALLKKGNVYEV